MASVGQETAVVETYGLSNIKSAISFLSSNTTQVDSPTTHSCESLMPILAEAFCNSVSVLSIYRACGFLHEGDLRRAVQLLIFKGLVALRPAVRLLTVMQGLAGNMELSLQLLEQVSPSDYTALDSRTLALIAHQCGPKIPHFGDFVSVLLSRIESQDSEDAKFALAHVFQTFCDPPKVPELAVENWTSEVPAAPTASIWKELKWAEFARTHCVSNGSQSRSAPSSPSDSESAHFCNLPDTAGPALPHYVSVCGVWLRRRIVRHTSSAAKSVPSYPSSVIGHPNVVITPSIHTALRQIASVISFGMPLILEGPSGCGKTTTLSLLARKTVAGDTNPSSSNDAPGVIFVQLDSIMSNTDVDSFSSMVGGIVPLPEGGGFRWRPGPIGLALERGDWLVFENGGSATASSSIAHVLHRLAELCPGDQFEAPGLGGSIQVATGFRCILTRTTPDKIDADHWEPPGGWELWRRVRMPGLSDQEVEKVLQTRFPLVSDCIRRVMSAIAFFRTYLTSNTGVSKILPSLRESLHICYRLDSLRHGGGAMTAESAFLECFDVLLAWCPPGKHRRNLLDFLASCWSMSVDIAERLLSTNVPSLARHSEIFRVGRASLNIALHNQPGRPVHPNLCLNGHTLRLFEQIMRSIQVGENVLLTGETGSGKTSVIQEISSLLGKELKVVNLSRQSELSDLVGNFVPVEVGVMVPQLAKRFEQLFCEHMSKERNARFLDALQKAARASSQHERALRLMKGAVAAVPRHVKTKTPDTLQRWNEIYNEVDMLGRIYFVNSEDEQQCNLERPTKRSRRSHDDRDVRRRKVDFKFCDGVLVKAMRAGHWVLLDEINLAPPELLERLISVIDRGEVLLSDENGELIKCHPDFTLFGAMNPPTDVGKKPLPSALMVRFTELRVGEIESPRDITDLILHRFFHRNLSLHSSGKRIREEDEVAESTAKFFLDCLKLAKDGRVEDTTGKPVRYSTRTLTRMLDFANGIRMFMKPGYSSIRRSLYEGALVAFGTSLPRSCRGLISVLASQLLLGAPNRLPHLSGIYDSMSLSSACMLEGFPLASKHSTSEGRNPSSDFIISPTVKQTLQQVCRAMLIGAPTFPILLQGPTAAGKTSIVIHLAEYTGNRLTRINNHEHTELSEYLGGYTATANGSLQFYEGPLVRAARLGEWVLLDELNLAPPDVLEALNRLLDDNREIFVPETGEVVKAVPGFRLFATQNPPGLYGGRKELSRAFRSRFIELQVDELPDEDLLLILEKRCFLPRSFARGMISVMRELQMRRRTSTVFTGREGFVTARDLFRWSSRRPRSKEELAMHGFFLLGERARHRSEREIVRSVLVSSLGITAEVLSDKFLYEFGGPNCTLTPSQECTEVSLKKLGLSVQMLFDTLVQEGIVSTPHTRRMLILMIHSMANKEPALLVGPTGTGKTSCCASVCSAQKLELLSINCHRHTETSDLLGGFCPVRGSSPGGPLFEWRNGPLVESMIKGSALLIDEINMSNDAVIERLNSVLEPKRTLLLSEKGSVFSDECGVLAPEEIKAKDSFVVLATMNPGGDFGKKELSPALRNRFTEIWMPQPQFLEDYVPIVHKTLSNSSFKSHLESDKPAVRMLTGFLKYLLPDDPSMAEGNNHTLTPSTSKQSFLLTLRDIKRWCLFASELSSCSKLCGELALIHGARLVFLDGLSVGSVEGWQINTGRRLWDALLALMPESLRSVASTYDFSRADLIGFERNSVATDPWCIEVGTFRVTRNLEDYVGARCRVSPFSFDAPNALRNTARLARAMCVGHHPLLLEGPPGGGKTSLIEALAIEAGFSFVRVNLSEATEISDLIGSDAPSSVQGTFTFREGSLLKAMRQGSWLLLDELNLASQSVLEGLNSVLDHRREIYVPELKAKVYAHRSFRIFGAQNPVSEGGGRRGLPKSFLNRFVKVWIEPPDEQDICAILISLHPMIPQDTIYKMVSVLERVRHTLGKNIPGVLGLRDALRWCDVLASFPGANASYVYSSVYERGSDDLNISSLIGEMFDVAVLQGIPDGSARASAENIFESVFGHKWQINKGIPAIREMSNGLRIGLGQLKKTNTSPFCGDFKDSDIHSGPAHLRELQALSVATKLLWPVVLYSESSSRSRYVGRRIVELAAASCGKQTYIISGGSLTDLEGFIGGYCQQDVTWAFRHCLKCWRGLLRKLFCTVDIVRSEFVAILQRAAHLVCFQVPFSDSTSKDELISSVEKFLVSSLKVLEFTKGELSVFKHLDHELKTLLRFHDQLRFLKDNVQTGHSVSFEWRKSNLLQAIERGDWILLQDADQCPPSVLDRINPLFERLSSALTECNTENKYKEMIIAEAPSEEDGSPLYIRPHPEFRMFFSVTTRTDNHIIQGLSRALIDRSLRIYISGPCSSRNMATTLDESFHRYHRRFERASNASMESSIRRYSTELSSSFVGLRGDAFLNSDERNLLAHTRISDLVIDSNTAVVQRDVYSLRIIEKSIDEIVSDSLKSLESFGNYDVNLQRTFELNLQNKSTMDAVRKLICVSGLAVLFGSTSRKDYDIRLNVLSSRIKETSQVTLQEAYKFVVSVGRAVESSCVSNMESSDSSHVVLSGIPWDPTFALDRTSLLFSFQSQYDSTGLDGLNLRARRFRYELLAIQRLLMLWNYGSNLPKEQSYRWSQAKKEHELFEKGILLSQSSINVSALTYSLIREIVMCCSSTCNETYQDVLHSADFEMEWLTVLEASVKLCESLLDDGSDTTDLFSPLFIVASSLNNLRRLKFWRLRPSGWFSSFSVFVNHLEMCLQDIPVLVMPTSAVGLGLESRLLDGILARCREHMSVLEYRAVVQAIVTVRDKNMEHISRLFESFEKLAYRIASGSDSRSCNYGCRPIRHWELFARNEVVLQFRKVVLSMALAHDRNEVLGEISGVLERVTSASSIEPLTTLSVQRMFWLVEEDRFGDECHKLILSDFLKELSATVFNISNDETVDFSSTGLGAALDLCKPGTIIPFWNLHNASTESVSAVMLTLCGAHMIDVFDSQAINLLATSIASALSDLETTAVNDDNFNSAQDGKRRSYDSIEEISQFVSKMVSGEPCIRFLRCALSGLAQGPRQTIESQRNEFKLRRQAFLGILWLCTGLVHLVGHLRFISKLEGIDPSDVSRSLMISTSRDNLENLVSQKAYTIIGGNRLGGEDPSCAVPMLLSENQLQRNVRLYDRARRRYVHRPSGSLSFKSYESFVLASTESASRIFENDLFTKVESFFVSAKSGCLKNEIESLTSSLRTTAKSLQCNGSLSHFRDCSPPFELGLRECEFGLACLQKSLHDYSLLAEQKYFPSLSVASSLIRFPYHAFTDSCLPSTTVQKCIEVCSDGSSLTSFAEYFLTISRRDGLYDVNDVSLAFAKIYSAWKTQLKVDEKAEERKSALHVLREEINRNDVTGGSVIASLDVNEESDFRATFNCANDELEQALLEADIQNGENSGYFEEASNNTEVVIPIKVNPQMFFDLHRKIFPADREGLATPPDVNLHIENMSRVCGHLHLFANEVIEKTFVSSSVWTTVCALHIANRFQFENLKDSYNFYSDPCVSELAKVSTAFQSLCSTIYKVQNEFFKDTDGHPVLSEIEAAVEKISKSCRSGDALSNIVIAVEHILRKIDEWHRLFSTRETRLDDDSATLSLLVVRFRKLEMSSWPGLLRNRLCAFERKATNWFFLLYDVVVGRALFSQAMSNESIDDIASSLDRFLRSSPVGEFARRIEMLTSISGHLLAVTDEKGHRCKLGRILRGIALSYSMFQPVVSVRVETMEKVVYTKLDEFTKLVSWTATEDLGSSQTMFKQKMKHLEYYRLKAAAEKTRRRLHKLCLEMDVIYRQPVYEFISKELATIGLQLVVNDNMSVKGQNKARFSETIDTACRELKFLDNFLPADVEGPLQFKVSDSSFLSRSPHLAKKINLYGKQLTSAKSANVDQALDCIHHLRKTIRQRVCELKALESPSVQLKKRSFVSLMHALRAFGLSPFYAARGDVFNAVFCFSSPSPSGFVKYDRVADELYINCVHHLRRLCEASDSRVRTSDISREEASRMVAFCTQIFEQVHTQRKSLLECMSAIRKTSKMAVALSSLEFDLSGIDIEQYSLRRLDDCLEIQRYLNRIKSCLEDVRVVEHVLEISKSLSQSDSKSPQKEVVKPSSLSAVLQQIQDSAYRSKMTLLAEKAAICRSALRTFIEDEDVDMTRTISLQRISFLDGRFDLALAKTRLRLTVLRTKCNAILEELVDLPSSNVLNQTLKPIVGLLDSFSMVLKPKVVSDVVARDTSVHLEHSSAHADDVLQYVLLSVQRIISWCGTVSDLKNTQLEQSKTSEGGLEFSKVLQLSNHELTRFYSESGLEGLLKSMERNEDFLSSISINKSCLKANDILRTVLMQRRVGCFVANFLEKIVTPCMRKAAQYHCNLMALLRTLTSLFIGLSEEGYCRPVEEPVGEEGRMQDVSGAGFGEANGGDMSLAQNVSKDVEDEEQLIGLQEENQHEPSKQRDPGNQNDEDAVDMTNDFDGDLLDDASDTNDLDENDIANEAERHLSGENVEGKETVDERMWRQDDTLPSNDDAEAKDGDGTHRNETASELVAGEGCSDTKSAEDSAVRDPLNQSKLSENVTDSDTSKEEHSADNIECEDESHRDETKLNVGDKPHTDGKPLDEGEVDNNNETGEHDTQNGSDHENDEREKPFEEVDGTSNAEAGTENHDKGGLDEVNHSVTNDIDVEQQHRNDGSETAGSERSIDCDTMTGELNNGRESEGDNLDVDIHEEDSLRDDMNIDDMDIGELSDDEHVNGDDSPHEELSSESVGVDGDKDDTGLNGDKLSPSKIVGDEENENAELPSSEAVPGMATTGQSSKPQSNVDGMSVFSSGINSGATVGTKPPADAGDPHGEAVGESGSNEKGTNHGGEQSRDYAPNTRNLEKVKNEKRHLQDSNPLRASADVELVQHWEKIIEAVENTGIDDFDNDDPSGNGGPIWEFVNQKENRNSFDEIALAEATNEQHVPLPAVDSDDDKSHDSTREREDKHKAMDIDDLPSQSDRAPLSKAIDKKDKRESFKSQDTGEEGETANPETRKHPAREAIESNDHNVPSNFSHTVTDVAGVCLETDNHTNESSTFMEGNLKRKWVIDSLNDDEASNLWRALEGKVSHEASALCEELRLVLEPTTASSLAGGYRTGKRLNMRKVIEYVASDFRKDRIWLRRTKADKRSYDVMVAIDDSASMVEGEGGAMALESVALLLSAMGKLEVGRVAVVSFGSSTRLVRDFDETLPISHVQGGHLLQHFTFSQTETDLVNLLDFAWKKVVNEGQSSASETEHLSLLFVISDGRLSNREEIKRYVRRMKDENILVAAVIIDEGASENNMSKEAGTKSSSIFDVKRVEYDGSGNISVIPYMHEFPIMFYVVVQDPRTMPSILSNALKHWIEISTI